MTISLTSTRSPHERVDLYQSRQRAFDHRLDGRSRRRNHRRRARFFQIYYAPNNAVLTVVGDFDNAEARAFVDEYFSNIPAQPTPPPVGCFGV